MLERGRVDIIYLNEFTGWVSLKEALGDKAVAQFKTLDKELKKSDLRLMVTKTDPQAEKFIEAFNRKLRELQEKGVIDDLLKPYLGK